MDRFRSRSTGSVSGVKKILSPYSEEHVTYSSGTEAIEDFVGNRTGDNRLRLERSTHVGCIMNGISGNTAWDSFPIDAFYYSVTGGAPEVPVPADSVLATRLLALTNPSRGGFNVLAQIGEMKDVPKMLRHMGDILSSIHRPSGLGHYQELGAAYLSAQFGWMPLLRMLQDSLNFAESVSKRTRELERLYSKGGLKRRATLFEDSRSSEGTWALTGTWPYVKPAYQSRSTVKVWGTIRWLPTGLPPASLRESAYQAFFGGNAVGALQAGWELLPWSWFIDYFSTASDYLQASNNAVGATPTRACIMRHRKYRTTTDVTTPVAGVTCSPGVISAEIKHRLVYANIAPSLELKIPFLGGGQMAILGALVASLGIRRTI